MRSTCTAGTTLFKVTPQLHSTKPELRFSAGSKLLMVCWRFAMVRISGNFVG